MKIKNITKSIIVATILSCSLSSCILMTEDEKDFWSVEGQARIREREYNKRLKRDAMIDAINLQKFPNLPTCQGHVSPNWAKVAYDKEQGYCILRPEANKVEVNNEEDSGLKVLNKAKIEKKKK